MPAHEDGDRGHQQPQHGGLWDRLNGETLKRLPEVEQATEDGKVRRENGH